MQFKAIIKESAETKILLDILQEEWNEAFHWLTDVIDEWSMQDFPQIVVATDGKEIIGYYSLVVQELIRNNHGYTPWLGTLFVRKKYRNNHYSPILLEDACQRVKNMGYENLFLATEHIRYYEKFGFNEVRLELYNWGEPTKIYQKKL